MAWLTWQGVPPGLDSHAYWAAWSGDMYGRPPNTMDAYLYSPAFAQALWPLAQLPWPVFGVVWAAATVAALIYLLAPLGWRWVAPLLLICSPEVVSGNVFWLLALVAVFGIRHPYLWAFPLLTKLTPGLGPLWFAVRREWRNVAISASATVLVVAVSYALSPNLWVQWVDFLVEHAASSSSRVGATAAPPLLVRLPIALSLLVLTALTDRLWGLPLAMVLVTPVAGIAALTILAAVPRLLLTDVARPRGRAADSPSQQSDQGLRA
jgi:hypothetical protein